MAQIRFGEADPPAERDGPRCVEIPPARYTSAAFLELERAHLWPNTWLLAGVAADLPNPGSYLVFELGHESVLVVRDHSPDGLEGGVIRAFHNVCQHRGHTLRDPGAGECARFVCPYHGWAWGTDGALCRMPNPSRFDQGLPPERRRLAAVACEVWAGLVWVCLGEPAQTLRDYLGPIHTHVGAYGPEHFRVNTDWTAEWPCNWKTAIDGFNETYHGHATHPQFGELLDTMRAEFQFGERHSVFIIPHGVRLSSFEPEKIKEPVAGWLRRAGVEPSTFTGTVDEARALAQRFLRAEAQAQGYDVTHLCDEQLTDTHHFYVFPNLHIDFHGADDLSLQRFRPHPTDPDRCLVDVIDCKRGPAEPGRPRPLHQHLAAGSPQRGIVYAQDIERLSRVQRGLHSRGFAGGAYLSHLERRIYHMHLVIDAHLGDHVPPALRTRVRPAAAG